MTTRVRIIAAALAGLALTGPAMAQTGAPPNASIDTAGLRTGMTEAELRAALAKAGFPAQDTKITATPPPATTRSEKSTLNQLPQTEFLNSIVAKKFAGAVSAYGGVVAEKIQIAFFGPGNESRAWAIARTTRYAPADAPSFESTLAALSAKYGKPSQVNPANYTHWWWDANGNLLPAKERPDCVRAIHDTQMLGSDGPWEGSVTNLAAIRVPPFPGIVRSECAYGVRAQMNYDGNRNIGILTVLMVALKDANAASVTSAKMVDGLSAARAGAAKAAADARKPSL